MSFILLAEPLTDEGGEKTPDDVPLYFAVPGVSGSVRVLNVTYHDDMANTSSQAFNDIAEPFCQEVGLTYLSYYPFV